VREAEVLAEIGRRARALIDRTHLEVDYYRIRRTIAVPLPVDRLWLPAMEIPGIPEYPWGTWLSWEIEERVDALAWAGSLLDDGRAREAAARDLRALAAWPTWQQYRRPDLAAAHLLRTMTKGVTQWSWLPDQLRRELEGALRRGVDDGMSCLGDGSQHHNISLIFPFSLAGAATAGSHPHAARLVDRAVAAYRSVLDLRAKGHSEGVAYDGYVLDFIASLARLVPEVLERLRHPRLDDLLDQSLRLAVPGDAANVAEIGDVEPRRMSFHLSAQLKLAALAPEPRREWLASTARVDWLRVDALAALHDIAGAPVGAPAGSPPPHAPEAPERAVDAHYALCLRTGWGVSDLAVAVSASSSTMSHLHLDTGSIVIGTRGRWIITDPGYQQYMRKREREFTLGKTAHNCPVLNDTAQVARATERHVRFGAEGDLRWAWVDMTACYPAELGISRARRHLRLLDGDTVVVADELEGRELRRADYCWHGDREAAWWVADGWARIVLPEVTLWLGSPSVRFGFESLDRLPGSRGSLSLRAGTETAGKPLYWIFSLRGPREARVAADGRSIEIEGLTLELPRD